MPLFSPRKLSPRCIMAELLPRFFRVPKHPQQSLKDDVRAIKVPWDADEIFYRVKFKEKKFEKHTFLRYDKRGPFVNGRPENAAWCVATGCLVPRRFLVATHIFPVALGSNVMEFLSGARALWSCDNGLLLPRPVMQALDDLALMIVPGEPSQPFADAKQDLKFYVTDHSHPAMSQPLFLRAAAPGLPDVTTGQLHEKRLLIPHKNIPRIDFLYLQSCCVVWKQTYLEDPACENEADFTARFLSNISKYWQPEVIGKGKLTDAFLLKCREAMPDLEPKPKTKKERPFRRLEMEPPEQVSVTEAAFKNALQAEEPATEKAQTKLQNPKGKGNKVDASAELRQAEERLKVLSRPAIESRSGPSPSWIRRGSMKRSSKKPKVATMKL